MIRRLEMLGFNFYSAKDVKVIADFVYNDPANEKDVIPLTLFPGNRSKDFVETWSEVKGG